MSVLYPSNEWCEEWKKAMNSGPLVRETGRDWGTDFNGNWVFEITPGAGLDKTIYLYLEAKKGECIDACLIDDPSQVEAGFFCSGSYEEFKLAVKGQKDFVEGVVRGVFKLKGDMSKIMRHARFIRAVANSISSFDSRFLGE